MAHSKDTPVVPSAKRRIPPGIAISETGSRWPLPDGEVEKLSLMDRMLDWLGTLRKR